MIDPREKLRQYIGQVVDEALAVRTENVAAGDAAAPTRVILAHLHGYARSLDANLPIAADGSPVPWYTYPAIEYLNQLDASGLRIFEYGSGNSSLYWARKGANVWCVEHDPHWYERMRQNPQLRGISLCTTKESYTAAVAEVGQTFDVVIVDGAWRNESAEAALAHLSDDGIVILDNSDWYTDVARLLRSHGLFQVDFNGFGPINNYCWTTSVFLPLRSPLAERLRQPQPIGGIEAVKGEDW